MVNFEDRDTYEWKKKVLKKVYECIARYGTISYDFERNEERRYYALDYWWLFHLLYEENQEQDQYRWDIENLRSRLRQIPGEIEQEKRIIENRFADPQPRLFPVAVTFLVPRKMAKGIL